MNRTEMIQTIENNLLLWHEHVSFDETGKQFVDMRIANAAEAMHKVLHALKAEQADARQKSFTLSPTKIMKATDIKKELQILDVLVDAGLPEEYRNFVVSATFSAMNHTAEVVILDPQSNPPKFVHVTLDMEGK